MELSFTREVRVPVGDPKLASIKIDRFRIIKVGDEAPQFAAQTLDGKDLKLGDLKGKVVLLDFWATWCAPCLAEMPRLKTLHDTYGKEGDLVIVGISVDEETKEVKRFLRSKDMPWTQIALGPPDKNPIAELYNVAAVPQMFLINRDGKVVSTDLHGPALELEIQKLMKPQALADSRETAPGTSE